MGDDLDLDNLIDSIRENMAKQSPKEKRAMQRELRRSQRKRKLERNKVASLTKSLKKKMKRKVWDRLERRSDGQLQGKKPCFVKRWWRSWFGGPVDTISVPEILAELLEQYDFEDEGGMNPLPLYMEWMVDEYVGRKCQKLLDVLRKTHDICVERGLTAENYYDFNDLDNKVFYIPAEKCKVLCTVDQNCNFIAVFDQHGDRGTLHIRQYFDVWEPGEDEWDKKEEQEYKDKGIAHAIWHADELNRRYSNAFSDNSYVDRPSLDWFKSRNFGFRGGPYDKGCGYGDCRDPGYILSWEYGSILCDFEEGPRKADRVIHSISLARIAFLDFECALVCLEEESE